MALSGLRELALFAGAGGGILGGKLLGWRTVCAVEIEAYPRSVLLARQRDGILEPFPIWDDVTTFDGHLRRGCVDVVSGGFPCQDISAAGKGAGIGGERSGLWKHMARIIGEVQPCYVLVENSPLLVSRGLDIVLADLATLGYDARWGVIGAHHAGAPHKRDRIWIVAHSNRKRCETRATGMGWSERPEPGRCGEDSGLAHTDNKRLAQRESQPGNDEQKQPPSFGNGCQWWDEDPADIPHATGERCGEAGKHSARSEKRTAGTDRPVDRIFKSHVGRVVDVCPSRVDRLKALGNMQVSRVVKLAWETLSGE